MSKKKTRNNPGKGQSKSAAKKAAVLGSERKSKAPLFISLIAAAAIAGGGYLFLGGKSSSGPAATAVAASSDQTVSFPVSLFEDGKARYFKYDAPGGMQVRYFILKSSDGIIRAAFDSCDVCWTANKGYRQEGDYMVCNNCGQRFPSVKVNVVKGGCNPAPLNRSIQGDKLVIKVADIIEGGNFYFNFKNRRRG
jgi:uncharacterized membrane protein